MKNYREGLRMGSVRFFGKQVIGDDDDSGRTLLHPVDYRREAVMGNLYHRRAPGARMGLLYAAGMVLVEEVQLPKRHL